MDDATFHYRYFIHVPMPGVYAYLAEPRHYIGLSPLVTEVSPVAQGKDAEGHTVLEYEAVETFRFLGVLRYPNRIKVRVILNRPDEQMIQLVESKPNVRLRFVFDFEAENGGTWVSETVTAHTTPLLRGFVVAQAQKVQRARSQILKQRMEGS